MDTFEAHDTHGRRTIPGGMAYIPSAKEKTIKANVNLAPKSKNGYTDPFTYYHVLDVLLSVVPGRLFKTGEFMEKLENRPLLFDPITVGRTINDINESLLLANGRAVINQTPRYWDGRRYAVSGDVEDRIAMENLLDDLREICLSGERDGESPLRRCSSLG